MNKKKILVIIVILVLVVISASLLIIGLNNREINEKIEPNLDNVTMEIKQGTLTKTGVTIIITDNNVNPYTYGMWFRIDKK